MSEWDRPEDLNDITDNGTMPNNVEFFAECVVGRKIVKVEQRNDDKSSYWESNKSLQITLDDGRTVSLVDTHDCCAYTELKEFFVDPEAVNHVITDVKTTDGYETWHVLADFGDILRLKVGWSAGNPFYYAYGFYIKVEDETKN